MGYITNFTENKILFTLCDCKSEILVIEYDSEFEIADLAIYETGCSYRNKIRLWQKLRYCWRVIVGNKPFADQIMLTKKQIRELKDFLSELC